jgi:hypothetical protein
VATKKSKIAGDAHNEIFHTGESVLPPKKLPAEREAALAQGEAGELIAERRRRGRTGSS